MLRDISIQEIISCPFRVIESCSQSLLALVLGKSNGLQLFDLGIELGSVLLLFGCLLFLLWLFGLLALGFVLLFLTRLLLLLLFNLFGLWLLDHGHDN